jgi:hypothetical protein
MSEVFNESLWGNLKGNIWDTVKREASGLSKADIAQLSLDIAGIFDPTGAADAAGTLLSAARGDWWGAGLSLLGVIPYIGDVGKLGKIGKVAPKTAEMLGMFMKGAGDLSKAGADTLAKYFSPQQIIEAKRKATEAVRKAMQKKRNKDPNCKECKKIKRANRMPTKGGKWNTPDGKPPKDGNGTFTLDQPKKLPDGSTVDKIEFKDGFPDFDKYTHGGPGNFKDIDGMTGDPGKDMKLLRDQHGIKDPGDGWTLHHHENGSVGYIPSELNNTIPHTGGASIIDTDLY